MEERINDNIEQIFISGFEDVQLEQLPNAWSDMSALLDKSRKKRIIFWIFGIGMGLMALTFSIYPFFKSEGIQKTSSEITPLQDMKPSQNLVENSVTEDGLDSTSIRPISKVSSVKAVSATLNRNTQRVTEQKLAPNNERVVISKPIIQQIAEEPTKGSIDSIQGDEISVIESLEESDSLLVTLIEKDSNNIKPNGGIERVIPARYKGFRYGIAASIEGSSSGLLSKYSPGFRTGILGEYKFKNGIALGSGAYISRKNYESSLTEYTAPAGFWTNGIKPNNIEGNCTMVEVPLELGYYLSGNEGKSLYFGVGVSSYLMLGEEYTYSYETNTPNLVQNWSTKNGPDYWFKVGQLRVGYSIPSSRLGEFQISTYSHIPLAPMGHGNVNIHSSGLEVRWKFRQKLRVF